MMLIEMASTGGPLTALRFKECVADVGIVRVPNDDKESDTVSSLLSNLQVRLRTSRKRF